MSSYATLTDLDKHGIAALGSVDTTTQQAALDAASALADSYLNDRVDTPITSPSLDLVMAVVNVASWNLLCRRGFNPESVADSAVRMRYEDAIRWFEKVAAGSVTPACVKAQADSPGIGGPMVLQPTVTSTANGPQVVASAPSARGW